MDLTRSSLAGGVRSGRVSLGKSGPAKHRFQEHIRSRLQTRKKLLVVLRRCIAGVFLLIVAITIPALVLRLRRSIEVPQHVPQFHHVAQEELPQGRASVLATITAADSTSLLSTADHALMRTGTKLSTVQQL